MNNNRNNSPLLEYLETNFKYQGKKNIGFRSIQKIKVYVDSLLSSCCLDPLQPFSNIFVTTVYNMLNTMTKEKAKLKLIKKLVDHKVTCCS